MTSLTRVKYTGPKRVRSWRPLFDPPLAPGGSRGTHIVRDRGDGWMTWCTTYCGERVHDWDTLTRDLNMIDCVECQTNYAAAKLAEETE